MTKAMTEGAKLRAKRGRPAADVPRYANGRALSPEQRKRRVEIEREEMEPTLRHRCALMGWRPTAENLDRARDQRLGNPGGRLLRIGAIDEDQYLALCEYRDAKIAWGKAHDAPWPHARCCAWAREASGGGTSVYMGTRTPEDRVAAVRANLAVLERVLTASMVVVVNEIMADDADEWSPVDKPAWLIRDVQLAAAALARALGRRL